MKISIFLLLELQVLELKNKVDRVLGTALVLVIVHPVIIHSMVTLILFTFVVDFYCGRFRTFSLIINCVVITVFIC